MNIQKSEIMRPTKKKISSFLVILAILALLTWAFFSSFMNRGSSPISNRKMNNIYSWKAGSLRVRGLITPNNCALTTSKCKCTLSTDHKECLFNFTFEGLNHYASIKVKDSNYPGSLTYDIGKKCTSDTQNRILGCSITYKWDKPSTVLKDTQILLSGPYGTEVLLTIQTEANNSNKNNSLH